MACREDGINVRMTRDAYLVSSARKVIKSLRSLGFLRPPKAILVPGMYFLGFSRYSNCHVLADESARCVFVWRNVRECRCSTRCPSACWRRCMSSPQRIQSCDRRDRGDLVRLCFPHPPLSYGIGRIVSISSHQLHRNSLRLRQMHYLLIDS